VENRLDFVAGKCPHTDDDLRPVAQTHIDYSSENKVAHSLPMLPPLAKGETNVVHSFAVFAGGGPGAAGPGPDTTYAFRTRTESGEASSADIKTSHWAIKQLTAFRLREQKRRTQFLQAQSATTRTWLLHARHGIRRT
jgi:hypothetical protein